VAGGQVYTFGAEGVLTCVSFATGKRIWQVKANEDYGVSKGFFGAASTPLIDGNRLFQNLGGADGAGIIALDKDTGKLLWKATEDDASYSSPLYALIF
jgi:outer membrane protein assembly factor BamB